MSQGISADQWQSWALTPIHSGKTAMIPALWSLAIDIEAWPLGKPDVKADAESPEGKMHCIEN